MGEVYLAIDGKLDREVPIKVRPEAMTRDPERVAGFEREPSSKTNAHPRGDRHHLTRATRLGVVIIYFGRPEM